ncbi:potassium-transporting ATPase subunit KdpC [Caulobacter sp. NIBR1757]|uniref:potassium-transporting ATPase subunit KdpC n=1 Tax=Caulobacter sp. NIBR1757 TaxID=3016000 RepID=UPI0022EFFEDE|nr:potassium-transporting ATPase subunit KdpC [Caulobacter sp. NIBR1757]WGM37765.1 Potassium-transporting ATPase KdpC subunit [Caulobacter sp. NIBR1757]
MLSHLRPALVSMALFTAVLGLAYPLTVTGIAQAALPAQANGSLVVDNGKVVGSALIAQGFSQPGYLHPRPSAAGKGYDAAGSSGSNYGPLNEDYAARIKADADALRADNASPIPVDAVTTSGSGLDPDVSPANAERQVARIAAARGMAPDRVRAVIAKATQGPTLGFLGQPRVNVLKVNLALDAASRTEQRPAR